MAKSFEEWAEEFKQQEPVNRSNSEYLKELLEECFEKVKKDTSKVV